MSVEKNIYLILPLQLIPDGLKSKQQTHIMLGSRIRADSPQKEVKKRLIMAPRDALLRRETGTSTRCWLELKSILFRVGIWLRLSGCPMLNSLLSRNSTPRRYSTGIQNSHS